jgi:hypothetical protein
MDMRRSSKQNLIFSSGAVPNSSSSFSSSLKGSTSHYSSPKTVANSFSDDDDESSLQNSSYLPCERNHASFSHNMSTNSARLKPLEAYPTAFVHPDSVTDASHDRIVSGTKIEVDSKISFQQANLRNSHTDQFSYSDGVRLAKVLSGSKCFSHPIEIFCRPSTSVEIDNANEKISSSTESKLIDLSWSHGGKYVKGNNNRAVPVQGQSSSFSSYYSVDRKRKFDGDDCYNSSSVHAGSGRSFDNDLIGGKFAKLKSGSISKLPCSHDDLSQPLYDLDGSTSRRSTLNQHSSKFELSNRIFPRRGCASKELKTDGLSGQEIISVGSEQRNNRSSQSCERKLAKFISSSHVRNGVDASPLGVENNFSDSDVAEGENDSQYYRKSLRSTHPNQNGRCYRSRSLTRKPYRKHNFRVKNGPRRFDPLPLQYWGRSDECKDAKAEHMDRVDSFMDDRVRLVLETTLWQQDVVLEDNMFPCKSFVNNNCHQLTNALGL